MDKVYKLVKQKFAIMRSSMKGRGVQVITISVIVILILAAGLFWVLSNVRTAATNEILNLDLSNLSISERQRLEDKYTVPDSFDPKGKNLNYYLTFDEEKYFLALTYSREDFFVFAFFRSSDYLPDHIERSLGVDYLIRTDPTKYQEDYYSSLHKNTKLSRLEIERGQPFTIISMLFNDPEKKEVEFSIEKNIIRNNVIQRISFNKSYPYPRNSQDENTINSDIDAHIDNWKKEMPSPDLNYKAATGGTTDSSMNDADNTKTTIVDKSDCIIDPNGIEQVGYFSVESSTREHLSSPLFQAVMDGDATSSIDLLNNGANANEKVSGDDGYYTPLMIASSMGANQIVKCLLKKGADSSVVNRQGRTALMFAAENCRDNVVNTLVEGGTDVNVKDKDNKDVLYFAAVCSVSSKDKSYRMIKALLAHGANPNVVCCTVAEPGYDPLPDSALNALALNSNNVALAEMMKAGAKNSKEGGLWGKPSESVPYYDKLSYDVIIGATSSDILSLKKSGTYSASWSPESNKVLGYDDAVAYCKNIDGYRLPAKTELQVAFVNEEAGFKPDVYHTNDLGDGMQWTRKNDGQWEKEAISEETKDYYVKQGYISSGSVNMYNGIYYTVMGKVRTRCIK